MYAMKLKFILLLLITIESASSKGGNIDSCKAGKIFKDMSEENLFKSNYPENVNRLCLNDEQLFDNIGEFVNHGKQLQVEQLIHKGLFKNNDLDIYISIAVDSIKAPVSQKRISLLTKQRTKQQFKQIPAKGNSYQVIKVTFHNNYNKSLKLKWWWSSDPEISSDLLTYIKQLATDRFKKKIETMIGGTNFQSLSDSLLMLWGKYLTQINEIGEIKKTGKYRIPMNDLVKILNNFIKKKLRPGLTIQDPIGYIEQQLNDYEIHILNVNQRDTEVISIKLNDLTSMIRWVDGLEYSLSVNYEDYSPLVDRFITSEEYQQVRIDLYYRVKELNDLDNYHYFYFESIRLMVLLDLVVKDQLNEFRLNYFNNDETGSKEENVRLQEILVEFIEDKRSKEDVIIKIVSSLEELTSTLVKIDINEKKYFEYFKVHNPCAETGRVMICPAEKM
jgi:hypothetical protein